MFDARTVLATIWRRLRASRTPVAEITAPQLQLPPPARSVRNPRDYSPTEPYSWDVSSPTGETRQ